jgi:hypothetical protein
MQSFTYSPSRLPHALAALSCALVGLVLAIVPHLAVDGPFLASGDDVIYLVIARPVQSGESALRDPYAAAHRQLPTPFSWFQFAPFTAPLAQLGVPLLELPLVWRAAGGFATGLTLVLLLRRLFASAPQATIAALAIALVWLGDAGTIGGRPILETLKLVPHWLAGTVRGDMASEYGQYRVVSPLLNFPWLFLVLLGFAAGSRSLPRALLAGLGLGICILIYFFFWTALVGALGLYLLIHLGIWLKDRSNRAAFVEARFALVVLAVGVLVGGYQIGVNAVTFADPAYRAPLDRTSLGYHVPPGDPLRTHYLVATWAFAELAVGAVAIWRTRHRGLGLLWLLALCGYLLKNSAIVTGLEFENYHWNFIQNSIGSLVLFASLLLLAPRLRWPLLALGVGLALFAGLWRAHESRTAKEAVEHSRRLKELAPLAEALGQLSPDHTLAGPSLVDDALLLSRCGQLYQSPHTAHRSLIDDAEVHERHALNAWVRGLSEAEYAEAAGDAHFSMTKSPRPEWQSDAVKEARLKAFRALEARGTVPERHRPLALLTPTGNIPVRGGSWRKLASSPEWGLWELVGNSP